MSKIGEIREELNRKNDEITRLMNENAKLTARVMHLELKIDQYQDRVMAISTPKENYHQFLIDKNTTQAEKEMRTKFIESQIKGLAGMEELGITGNGVGGA